MNTRSVFFVLGIMGIVAFAVIVTVLLQPKSESFSQILTFGPLWSNGNKWTCVSDADYLVYGALRGLEGSQISISIPDIGTQSLYQLDAGHLQSFTVGSKAGHPIIITKTGEVTGWITLHTMSGIKANCTQS